MASFNLNDYVDVQTRIVQFWQEHPEGAIRTELASSPDDFKTCRYRADVYKDASSAHPDATGYAFEVAGSGMANKTSHEENCETSAIGRALANLGYATSAKNRPSKQEMSKATPEPVQPSKAPQNASQAPAKAMPANAKPATEAAFKRIYAILGENGLDQAHLKAWATHNEHEHTRELTTDELKRLAEGLKSKTEVTVAYLTKLAGELELKQAGADLGAQIDGAQNAK